MRSIDKNDVDIEKLFKWGRKFQIVTVNGKTIDIYIRLVGDAELNRARVYALRKSAELRKKLRDENSDERLAFVPDIDLLEKDVLVETLILYITKEVTIDIVNTIRLPLPKEPASDATLEEQEKYQEEVDKWQENREKEIRKEVDKALIERRKELSKKSKEELYKEYERMHINFLCENEMVTVFREMSCYFGCYTDETYKEKFFKSFDEFNNLPPEIKNQLLENYSLLELGGEDLKKLLEAML